MSCLAIVIIFYNGTWLFSLKKDHVKISCLHTIVFTKVITGSRPTEYTYVGLYCSMSALSIT